MVQNLVKLVYTLTVMPKAAATPSISSRSEHPQLHTVGGKQSGIGPHALGLANHFPALSRIACDHFPLEAYCV